MTQRYYPMTEILSHDTDVLSRNTEMLSHDTEMLSHDRWRCYPMTDGDVIP